jgi:hypothetical protein
MSITINGSGTLTGISPGGLPDGVITTDDLANNAVTAAKIGTTEQSRLCAAWVNFNGTGTVAIRAQFNVSSITDNGVGNYTVNFATALADANYSVTATTTTRNALTATTVAEIYDTGTPSINTGSVIVTTSEVSAGLNRNPVDRPVVSVAIFR